MSFSEQIGIELPTIEPDFAMGIMPVVPEVQQPFGYLHGGATISLLETAASMGATASCSEDEIPFAVNVQVAHRSNLREGKVTGTARLQGEAKTSKGYRKQTWLVEARNDEGGIVSEGEIICLIVPRASLNKG